MYFDSCSAFAFWGGVRFGVFCFGFSLLLLGFSVTESECLSVVMKVTPLHVKISRALQFSLALKNTHFFNFVFVVY